MEKNDSSVVFFGSVMLNGSQKLCFSYLGRVDVSIIFSKNISCSQVTMDRFNTCHYWAELTITRRVTILLY